MRLNKPMLFLLVLIAAAAFTAQLVAAPAASERGKAKVSKVQSDDYKIMDINMIDCYVQNTGKIGENPATGGDGFYFPRGQRNSSIIYTSGIWVIGKVDGDIRSAAADYATEFQPGRILPDGNADDPTKPEYQVYKYNKGDAVDAAAIDQGCPAEVMGDQMTFSVFNDVCDHSGVWTKPPIGLEVQLTGWGFNRSPLDALGNTLFFRYRFINKSTKPLEEAYAAVFFDPDNGDGNDDYAGCDTTLGIGYVFNGNAVDKKYGVQAPSMGCDFFQGPIVDSPGSSVSLPDGTVIPDKKMLSMTTFFVYFNGSPIAGMTDPSLADANGAQEAYFFVQGRLGNGEPYTDPGSGLETTFPFAGDPVAGTGWLMNSISAPKDVRMGLAAGPFTLAAGETQDVVIGLVVGQGGDNLSSITVMKFYDKAAQLAYDLNFNLPSPPPQPIVKIAQDDQEINLTWDDAAVNFSDKGYAFEGYNVYQGPSSSGPWKRIATFDKKNGITTIWDQRYSESIGALVLMPVQPGADMGLRYNFYAAKDYVTNSPLVNGKQYFFAVTGYSYNPDGVPKVLENGQVALVAIPQKPVMDVAYNSQIGDTLAVASTGGMTDGSVICTVMDPAKLTGHTYEITFYEITDTNSPNAGKTAWKMTDMATAVDVLKDQVHQASANDDEDFLVVDGLKVKVFGTPLNFKNFQVVSNAGGPLDPPEIGCFAFNGNGFPFLLDYNLQPVVDADGAGIDRPTKTRQQIKAAGWGIHTGMNAPDMATTYKQFVNRTTNDGARWPKIIPNDFEIRFTAAGGKGYIPNAFGTGAPTGGFLIDVPFELWNVGTSKGAEDDVRYFPSILDDDNNQKFNLLTQASVTAAGDWSYGIPDHGLSGGTNDPQTDWFYWVIPADMTPGQAGYEALVAKIQAEGDNYEYLDGTNGDCMRRMVLVAWNGGLVDPGVYESDMPEVGTTFRILTTKPNDDRTKFEINTADYKLTKSADVAKDRLQSINVFPNPYFGGNKAETDFFAQFVTFNNLPEKCTIRIFSLSGQLVRTLAHGSGTPFERWNLLNEESLPVASGVFIVHITTDFGDKVLKLSVINREQRYLHN